MTVVLSKEECALGILSGSIELNNQMINIGSTDDEEPSVRHSFVIKQREFAKVFDIDLDADEHLIAMYSDRDENALLLAKLATNEYEKFKSLLHLLVSSTTAIETQFDTISPEKRTFIMQLDIYRRVQEYLSEVMDKNLAKYITIYYSSGLFNIIVKTHENIEVNYNAEKK